MSTESQDTGTFAALAGLLLFGGLLLGLVSLVMPDAFKLLLVAGLFFGSFALHYLVWGRWLSRVLREQEEAAQAEAPHEAD